MKRTMQTTLMFLILSGFVPLNTFAQDIPYKRLVGHTDWVNGIAYSPDGLTLASGSWDGIIKLWEVNTGTLRNTLQEHQGSINSVAFSPDGLTLASSGGWNGTIKLWDVNTGGLRHSFQRHGGYVRSVAFSPDGLTLASGGGHTIKLWDVNTNTLQHTLEGHLGSVISVAFSPDGLTLASGGGGWDGTIKLWDVNTGTLRNTLQGHEHGVSSVAYSPDGLTLASSGSWDRGDRTIKLWDVNTGTLRNTLQGHEHGVNSVAYSPDGHTLASGSADATIKLWDVNTGTLRNTLEGHTSRVNSVVYSPDGLTLASGSRDGTVRLWYVHTPPSLTTISLSQPHNVAAGENFTLDAIVENVGGRAPAAMLQFYGPVKFVRTTQQATSGTLPAIDFTDKTLLGEAIHIAGLGADSTHKETITATAPETAGTYAYKGCIERVDETGKTIKVCSDVIPLTVIDPPDVLELPPNLISDVALTQNATYFIVNAQFPKLLLKNQGAIYGSCVITLGIPGVPDAPLEKWDSTHSWLAGEPLYFMFPLLSPQQRIDALEGTYDLDIKEVVIGGVLAAAGPGVAKLKEAASKKISEKVLPVLPLGKVTAGVVRVGSKLKIAIPPETVKEAAEETTRYVISKVVSKTTDFLIATGVNFIRGNVEEPSIENQLLAFTADPTMILVPTSEQETRPEGEARYLFRIPKQQLTEIAVTVEQVYFVGENAFTAKYQGIYPLEGAAAAPELASMSLVDYPPFQWLSPEAQAYLLRDFGMFTSAETWQVPETTTLLPNYPNPFNPETWIPYQLAQAADVALTIYDIHGRVIRELDLGHQRAGVYQSRSRAAYWDGRNAQGEPVASGLYFYTLKAGDFAATRKMLIRK